MPTHIFRFNEPHICPDTKSYTSLSCLGRITAMPPPRIIVKRNMTNKLKPNPSVQVVVCTKTRCQIKCKRHTKTYANACNGRIYEIRIYYLCLLCHMCVYVCLYMHMIYRRYMQMSESIQYDRIEQIHKEALILLNTCKDYIKLRF